MIPMAAGGRRNWRPLPALLIALLLPASCEAAAADACQQQGDATVPTEACPLEEDAVRSGILMQRALESKKRVREYELDAEFRKDEQDRGSVVSLPFNATWAEKPLENFAVAMAMKDPVLPSELQCSAAFDAQLLVISDGSGHECPSDCPYVVEQSGGFCHFACEKGEACDGTKWPFANSKTGACERCPDPGCATCSTVNSAAEQGNLVCSKCNSGFLLVDGVCRGVHEFYWLVFFGLLCIILIIIFVWYLDLRRSRVPDEEWSKYWRAFRTRTCLQQDRRLDPQPVASTEVPEMAPRPFRAPFGLTTNLLNTKVAGPGTVLFFRTQLSYIIFFLIVLLVWIAITRERHDLLELGVRRFSNQAELCGLIYTGFHIREEASGLTSSFVFAVYISGCLLHCIFGMFQHKKFNELQKDKYNLHQFCALLEGLPPVIDCARHAEETRLAEETAMASQERVIGVSICWDFKDREEEIELIHAEAFHLMQDGDFVLDGESGSSSEDTAGEPERSGLQPRQRGTSDFMHRFMRSITRKIVPAFTTADRPPPPQEDIVSMLKELHTGGCAFVVFETRQARNAAVARAQASGGIMVQGRPCSLTRVNCEPSGVIWSSFQEGGSHCALNLAMGSIKVLAGLIVWVLMFYLPYARFALSYVEQDPTLFRSMTLTMVVVAGNQVMYFLCRAVSLGSGLRFSDTVEVTYIMLYSFACALNLVLDLMVTYVLTLTKLREMQVKTVDGSPIEGLPSGELFDSFPMQKTMGGTVYLYAFPSCFLIPFVVEPFVVLFVGHVSQTIVATKHNVSRTAIEAVAKLDPMDLGRYADLWLNLVLVCVTLWMPAGYYLYIIRAFVFSHIVVYIWDHYRVLRCVEAFTVHSDAVDRFAHSMNAVPLALLVSCALYKYHFTPGSAWVLELGGGSIWVPCMLVALAHMVFQALFDWVVLPTLSSRFLTRASHSEMPTYPAVAKMLPATWFTMNPVHTLRSMYLHEHSPPCMLYRVSKDQFMAANPAIGCYFEGDAVRAKSRSNALQGDTLPGGLRRLSIRKPTSWITDEKF